MTGRDKAGRAKAAAAAAEAEGRRGLTEEQAPADDEGAPSTLVPASPHYVAERGTRRRLPGLEELREQLAESNPELLERIDGDELATNELATVVDLMPTHYVGVGHDVELEVAIRGYECDGSLHPVPVFAPKGSAVTVSGDPVDTSASLDDLLNGGVTVDAVPVVANALYMFESYCFHPDVTPTSTAGKPLNPPTLSGSRRDVVTLDTGRMPPTSAAALNIGWSFKDGGLDTWPSDEVSGHGPAIADLIGTLIGADGDSYLAEISPGVGYGHAYQLQYGSKFYRAFDSVMLLAALQNVEKEYAHCQVLNLSLGRAAIPSDVKADPVWTWIQDKWLSAPNERFVVAAAGNHGTCVPNFPAALFTDWSGKGGPALPSAVRSRIFSVGSERTSGFSGYADPSDPDHRWVRNIRPGRDIPITHHNPTWKSWTGTSFAAPQVSAELATGNQPN